jgi:hypothetical protein
MSHRVLSIVIIALCGTAAFAQTPTFRLQVRRRWIVGHGLEETSSRFDEGGLQISRWQAAAGGVLAGRPHRPGRLFVG